MLYTASQSTVSSNIVDRLTLLRCAKGNGASGLQVVPQIASVAKHLDHYARNPTWVASSFGGEERKLVPFTPTELESFQDDSTYYAFRKKLESSFFRRFGVLFKGSAANAHLREEIEASTKQRLKNSPKLLNPSTGSPSIFPTFSPACRRLTPGPGYLEALSQENVDYIRTPIERFTKTGIVTVDGVEREVDAVVCSTGADVSFAPPFSLVARGVDLNEAWRPGGSIGYPRTYLGIAAPGFPNFFQVGGPLATGHAGTIPHSIENQVCTRRSTPPHVCMLTNPRYVGCIHSESPPQATLARHRQHHTLSRRHKRL